VTILGGIIEGPSKWSVRPVAEVFYENEFGKSETISGLIGVIWRIQDNLSFDAGLRYAVVNSHSINEVRVGLTFGFPLQPFGVVRCNPNRPRGSDRRVPGVLRPFANGGGSQVRAGLMFPLR
jgi:hypothetical protein